LNPPRSGEHTREVLQGIGMNASQIEELISTKAVA
jgi:crotonobetainyl-CoA:carnitine CoA-transferase CaiB-like acyl-CoA transferase